MVRMPYPAGVFSIFHPLIGQIVTPVISLSVGGVDNSSEDRPPVGLQGPVGGHPQSTCALRVG